MKEETINPDETIGMTVERAAEWFEQYGYSMRITRKNGKRVITSNDFRTDRINVAIENNKIVEVLSVG